MSALLKFWTLSHRERLLFCEACVLVILAKLSVKTIAFRHIDRFLRHLWRDQLHASHRDDDIKLVAQCIARTARLIPSKNQCLITAIALFIMLRRRGIPAVICAGVGFVDDSELVAHAWVETGQRVIEHGSAAAATTELLRIG